MYPSRANSTLSGLHRRDCLQGTQQSAKPKVRPAAVVYPDAAVVIAPAGALCATRFASLIEDSDTVANIRRAEMAFAVIGGTRDCQSASTGLRGSPPYPELTTKSALQAWSTRYPAVIAPTEALLASGIASLPRHPTRRLACPQRSSGAFRHRRRDPCSSIWPHRCDRDAPGLSWLTSISCSSDDGKRHYCAVDTRGACR